MPTCLLDDVLDRVAFCDPSGGKTELKRTRARSAIVVIGQDALSRVFVLEAWADRCPTDTLINRIFSTQRQWTARTFGIEANAMQSLFADAVTREARATGVRLPVQPVQQPTRIDKDVRIRLALQPVIASGRLLVRADMRDLLAEIESFPSGQTKDLVDALASALVLLPRRTLQRQHDDEVSRLASYLRERGARPADIERRVAEARADQAASRTVAWRADDRAVSSR